MKKKLSDMTLEELWQLFPIVLEPHSEAWALWYEEERALLAALLPGARIRHIGSTAIPGIWAKPIVDILIECGDAAQLHAAAQRMAQAGYTQSILSASYQPSLDEQCAGLDVTKYMVAVDGLKDESAAKKTDIGRMQMERLGLTGEDVWFVGDMLADYELAQALGAACVLVTWGHNSEERVRAAGCPVADTLEALERILLG